MKNRLWYVLGFTTTVGFEILIGRFAHDRFIRPYLGDVLAVVALYFLVRSIRPRGHRFLAAWIFLFAVAVECIQGIGLAKLPLIRDSRLLRILFGSTFDWRDIACYAVGCGAIAAFEGVIKRLGRRRNTEP